MTSIPQQAEALQQILEEEAVRLAKETGFIERERAFNGADFAQALILGWLQRADERLEGFVQILERREVSITASGLSQRFSKEAATFMQRVLERLSQVQLQTEAVDVPLDHVPAEAVAEGEGALEVHARVGAEGAERRPRQRLVRDVGEERAAALRQHGQADAVDGDTLAALEGLVERRAEAQARAALEPLQRLDRSVAHDDAGEHWLTGRR